MNAAKQLALAAEALYACGFRGRARKLRRVADELALTEAAFDGIHAQLAELAAERDALAAKVERVRALHYAADNDAARTPICETCHGKAGVHECGCWADRDREPVCGHCREGHKGMSVAWPCPTLRALGEADR